MAARNDAFILTKEHEESPEAEKKLIGSGPFLFADTQAPVHVCGRGRNGRFTVIRRTMRERMQAKLRAVKAELGRRLHESIPEVGAWLGSVVRGHARYYGVAGNDQALKRFRDAVVRHWHRVLARRSQRARVSWARMARLAHRWLPPVTIYHPYASSVSGV